MLNGLIKPDGGRIEMRGRVGALIALGAGFNPILTGRENIFLYGADGDGNGSVNLNSKADALASTAKFLAGHGWSAGEGYQPGQANFAAIQGWNAASVYQKAIAIMGKRIDAP